jgi:hypothetical protein
MGEFLLQREYAEATKQNSRTGANIMTTDSHNANNSSTDHYAERAQRRAERRAARRANGGAWIGGVVLIGLGLIFLLQNTGALHLQNWWALFILIPALGAFGASYTEYRASGGHLNSKARGSIIAGLVFTAVAAVFLFNLNFSLLLPAVLILAGVGMLINTVLPD